MERAVILSPGPQLKMRLQDLNIRVPPALNGGHQTLQQAERTHILAILNETKWVLSGPNGAATRLGMNRSTLQFRMKKLGIVRPSVDANPTWPVDCQTATQCQPPNENDWPCEFKRGSSRQTNKLPLNPTTTEDWGTIEQRCELR